MLTYVSSKYCLMLSYVGLDGALGPDMYLASTPVYDQIPKHSTHVTTHTRTHTGSTVFPRIVFAITINLEDFFGGLFLLNNSPEAHDRYRFSACVMFLSVLMF